MNKEIRMKKPDSIVNIWKKNFININEACFGVNQFANLVSEFIKQKYNPKKILHKLLPIQF